MDPHQGKRERGVKWKQRHAHNSREREGGGCMWGLVSESMTLFWCM